MINKELYKLELSETRVNRFNLRALSEPFNCLPPLSNYWSSEESFSFRVLSTSEISLMKNPKSFWFKFFMFKNDDSVVESQLINFAESQKTFNMQLDLLSWDDYSKTPKIIKTIQLYDFLIDDILIGPFDYSKQETCCFTIKAIKK